MSLGRSAVARPGGYGGGKSTRTETKRIFEHRVPRLRQLLIATSVVSTLVAISMISQLTFHPSFDIALIWLHAEDVGGPNSPLLGPYSRFGWQHPGPLLYYALALPLRVMGMSPNGLLVGAFLVTLGSAVTGLLLTARRAGSGAACALALGLAGLAHGLDLRVIDPWNPHVLVLPFALFMISAWLWSVGSDRMLLILVGAGSFILQSHVGVVPPVAFVTLAACVLRMSAVRRSPISARPIIAGLLLATMLWAPPLWDELKSQPGNLSDMVSFFLAQDGKDASLGWSAGLQLASGELAPWGAWIGNQATGGWVTTLEPQPIQWLAAPFGLVALAMFFARRWRDRLAFQLAVIVFVALGACLLSYSQIRGLPYPYLAVWPRVVAMLCVSTPLLVLARRYWHPTARVGKMCEALATLVVVGVFCAEATTASVPDERSSEILDLFAAHVQSMVPSGTRVRAVAMGHPFTVSPHGLAVMLLRSDRDAQLHPCATRVSGKHRCAAATDILPTIALASGSSIEVLSRFNSASRVVRHDPLSPAERSIADELTAQLASQFRRLGREDLVDALDSGAEWLPWAAPEGVDRRLLERWSELAAGEQHRAYARFSFPPTAW